MESLQKIRRYLLGERQPIQTDYQSRDTHAPNAEKSRVSIVGGPLNPYSLGHLTGSGEVYLGRPFEPNDEGRFATRRGLDNERLDNSLGAAEQTDYAGRAIISGRRVRFRAWQLFQGDKLPKILLAGSGVPVSVVYKEGPTPYSSETYSQIVAEERPFPDIIPITSIKRNKAGKWHSDHKSEYPKTLEDVVKDSLGRTLPELTREEIEKHLTLN